MAARWHSTDPSFADDEESVSATALPDDVVAFLVDTLKNQKKKFINNIEFNSIELKENYLVEDVGDFDERFLREIHERRHAKFSQSENRK